MFEVSKWPLAREIRILETKFMKLGILDKDRALTCIEVRPTFIMEIKAKQFEIESLNELWMKMVTGKVHNAALDASGVLNFKGRICVLE